jgi:predicted phosphodiesterase
MSRTKFILAAAIYISIVFSFSCSSPDNGNETLPSSNGNETSPSSSSETQLSSSDGSLSYSSSVPSSSSSSNTEILSSSSKIESFTAEMLSLIPGSNTTELNLAWYSNTDGKKSVVHLFDASGKFVKTATGTSGAASTGKQWHKATLTGLTPGTQYKYSVSNDSIDWSYEYDYSVPAAEIFRFAAVGDPQVDIDSAKTAENWNKSVEKIAEAGANFIVSIGDQVEHYQGDEDEFAIFLAPAALRNIPLAPVMGNHDPHALFGYHFNLPNEQNKTNYFYRYNYFYLYNNVLFIALNTGMYQDKSDRAADILKNIFDGTIKAAKTANTGKYDWIVVQHHMSTRSISLHAEDVEILNYKAAGFDSLMAYHNVDLVIAGHDHIYARTKPIDGSVYLTLAPSGSVKFYPPVDSLAKAPYIEKYSPQRWFLRVPEYTIADVSGKKMTLKVYGTDGSSIDEFNLSK